MTDMPDFHAIIWQLYLHCSCKRIAYARCVGVTLQTIISIAYRQSNIPSQQYYVLRKHKWCHSKFSSIRRNYGPHYNLGPLYPPSSLICKLSALIAPPCFMRSAAHNFWSLSPSLAWSLNNNLCSSHIRVKYRLFRSIHRFFRNNFSNYRIQMQSWTNFFGTIVFISVQCTFFNKFLWAPCVYLSPMYILRTSDASPPIQCWAWPGPRSVLHTIFPSFPPSNIEWGGRGGCKRTLNMW